MKQSLLLSLGLLPILLVFVSACSTPPMTAADYYNSARAKYDKNDFDGAIADYTKAINLDPQGPNAADAYNSRGNAKYDKDDIDGAIADYDQAIALNPDDAIAYSNRGNAKNAKGDHNGAIADGAKAIALNPDAPQSPDTAIAYFDRGGAKCVAGDFDGAIADYDQAIALDPSYTKTYHRRGNAKQAKGDFEGAIADYTKTIELDPNFSSAYCDLAWLLATCPEDNIRNGAKAVEYATKACELREWKNARYLDTLAAADAEVGNFEEAVKWENRCLAFTLAKDDADQARLHLSLYMQKKPYHEAENSN
jgi:tetratricopeptide (TPR) repeat protein